MPYSLRADGSLTRRWLESDSKYVVFNFMRRTLITTTSFPVGVPDLVLNAFDSCFVISDYVRFKLRWLFGKMMSGEVRR